MAAQSNIRGVFIAGTDTGVGKTYIGTALVRAYREAGYQVFPRKPVESGCVEKNGQYYAADAALYAEALGNPDAVDMITPYRFKAVCSAARAARLENADPIDIETLRRAIFAGVNSEGMVVVEGAGGFYSPLTQDGNNADLAEALKLPVILVAADRLGCINHILLTLEAAQKRQINVAAIVLNQCEAADAAETNNYEEIMRYTNIPVLREFYRSSDNKTSNTQLMSDVLASLA